MFVKKGLNKKPFHFSGFVCLTAGVWKKKKSLKSMEIECVAITKSVCPLQILKETLPPVLILDTLFRKVLLNTKVHLVSSTKFSLLFSKKPIFSYYCCKVSQLPSTRKTVKYPENIYQSKICPTWCGEGSEKWQHWPTYKQCLS